MKNKKLKLALSELAKEMEVISKEEMKSFKGGFRDDYFYSYGYNPSDNGGRTDCVFQLMAHFSSGMHDAQYYKDKYDEKYSCSSTGDCATNGFLSGTDFNKLDSFFSELFDVKEFSSPEEAMSEGYKVGIIIDSDGDGNPDHAVQYLHINKNNGDILYKDTQINELGIMNNENIKHYIYVKEKN